MNDTDLHVVQEKQNSDLERTALGMTVNIGETLEFSNGITLIVRKKKGANAIGIVLLMPEAIKVYRQKGPTDEQRKNIDKWVD